MIPSSFDPWADAARKLLDAGGTALVIGDVDTGKTAFTTMVAAQAVAESVRIAVVDADIGQSEVGPPATVGVALPTEPFGRLDEMPVRSLEFVGSTSPRGHMVEHLAAARRAVDTAIAAGARVTLVDTTGLIRGITGRRLKQAKIRMLHPRTVVAIEHDAECGEALAGIRFSSATQVLRLPVPDFVHRKPASLRAQRRAARFARYFRDAHTHTIPMENVSLQGTWLGQGTPQPPHLATFLARTLGVCVRYAEMLAGHLGIVADSMPNDEQSIALALGQMRARAWSVTLTGNLQHLVLGLCDSEGYCLALGLLEAADFARRTLTVHSPLRAAASIRVIRFGLARVQPDGVELHGLRPGDI